MWMLLAVSACLLALSSCERASRPRKEAEKPCPCPESWNPVCDSDGKKYPNRECAECLGVNDANARNCEARHRSRRSAELVIRPSTNKMVKSRKSAVVFTCMVSKTPGLEVPYEIKWYDNDNQEISAVTGRVFTERNGPFVKLYVTDIRDEDTGRYRCSANIDGQIQEKFVELAIFEDIRFDHAPSTQYFVEHTDAVVECFVSGADSVSWKFEGARLAMGGRYSMDAVGLHIKDVTRDDAGEYWCRAEQNANGLYDERRITFERVVPPKITQQIAPLTERIKSETATLQCKASGLPQPVYYFFKDNATRPIQNSNRISVDETQGTLTFNPVQEGDSGKYTCFANSIAGQDSTSGSLRVLDSKKRFSS